MKAKAYINGEFCDIDIDVAEPSAEELRQEKLAEIDKLKSQLQSTDYKVVKLAECLAIGSEMPYNAQALHAERQALRDRINELEKEICL